MTFTCDSCGNLDYGRPYGTNVATDLGTAVRHLNYAGYTAGASVCASCRMNLLRVFRTGGSAEDRVSVCSVCSKNIFTKFQPSWNFGPNIKCGRCRTIPTVSGVDLPPVSNLTPSVSLLDFRQYINSTTSSTLSASQVQCLEYGLAQGNTKYLSQLTSTQATRSWVHQEETRATQANTLVSTYVQGGAQERIVSETRAVQNSALKSSPDTRISSSMTSLQHTFANMSLGGSTATSTGALQFRFQQDVPHRPLMQRVEPPNCTNTNQMMPSEPPGILSAPRTPMSIIRRIHSTQKHCCVCLSRANRSHIPNVVVANTWVTSKIFIPFENRCCVTHIVHATMELDDVSLHQIAAHCKLQFVPAKEVQDFTSRMCTVLHEQKGLEQQKQLELRKKLDEQERKTREIQASLDELNAKYQASTPGLDFGNRNTPDATFKTLLGLSKSDFENLYFYVELDLHNSCNRSGRNALAIFLYFMRSGVSQEMISATFNLPQQRVSDTIDSVSAALEKNFVPKFLGYQHMTKDELVSSHSTVISSILTRSQHTERTVLTVLDGTYFYIQKSMNFDFQKRSYSQHKYRNLLKAMVVCMPDGYIVEVEGMYYSDSSNNDASILNSMYSSNEGFSAFFEEDDNTILIVDRGFRDSVLLAESHGHEVVMPHLLSGRQKQLLDWEANESRLVTKIRWVVESVNGRIKNVFHFFRNVICTHYVESNKVQRFLRIACALLNKYFPVIRGNKEGDEELATFMVERSELSNLLGERVRSERWETGRLKWEPLSNDTAQDFPQLTLDDLRNITIGCYQLKNASAYAARHFSLEQAQSVEAVTPLILVNRDVPGILRFRMRSRFVTGAERKVFIQYTHGINGYEAIGGWYCSCVSGARVVGCCSHVASVLWFLGYARHTTTVRFPAQSMGQHVLDAKEEMYAAIEDGDYMRISGDDSNWQERREANSPLPPVPPPSILPVLLPPEDPTTSTNLTSADPMAVIVPPIYAQVTKVKKAKLPLTTTLSTASTSSQVPLQALPDVLHESPIPPPPQPTTSSTQKRLAHNHNSIILDSCDIGSMPESRRWSKADINYSEFEVIREPAFSSSKNPTGTVELIDEDNYNIVPEIRTTSRIPNRNRPESTALSASRTLPHSSSSSDQCHPYAEISKPPPLVVRDNDGYSELAKRNSFAASEDLSHHHPYCEITKRSSSRSPTGYYQEIGEAKPKPPPKKRDNLYQKIRRKGVKVEESDNEDEDEEDQFYEKVKSKAPPPPPPLQDFPNYAAPIALKHGYEKIKPKQSTSTGESGSTPLKPPAPSTSTQLRVPEESSTVESDEDGSLYEKVKYTPYERLKESKDDLGIDEEGGGSGGDSLYEDISYSRIGKSSETRSKSKVSQSNTCAAGADPPDVDVDNLYARVDLTKKKRNTILQSGSSS